MNTIEYFLSYIHQGKYLSSLQMNYIMQKIEKEEASHIQLAALFSMLSLRGESFEELLGAVHFLNKHSYKVVCDAENTIDLCGTGGDGGRTFNISTAAALVIASSGKIAVAKHGGSASSSQCGSNDVISALKIPRPKNPQHAEYMLKKHQFSFLFAPYFNPVFQKVGAIRRELKVKTLFNILGPLINPACTKRQVIGVFNVRYMEHMIRVMQANGTKEAIVMHARDGLDELSLNAPTDYLHLKNGVISQSIFHPRYFGFKAIDPTLIQGNSAHTNAKIIENIFLGIKGAPRDIVTFNAALGFMVGGVVDNLGDGLDLAKECIDHRKTINLLNALRQEVQYHE